MKSNKKVSELKPALDIFAHVGADFLLGCDLKACHPITQGVILQPTGVLSEAFSTLKITLFPS